MLRDKFWRERTRPTIALLFLFSWLSLLGIQLVVSYLPFRFAPADCVIAAYSVYLFWKKRYSFALFYRREFLMLITLFTFSLFWGYKTLGYYTTYALFNKFLGFGVLLLSVLCVCDWIKELQGNICLLVRIFTLSTGLLNVFYLLGYSPLSPALRDAVIFLPSTEARLRGLMVDPNAYGGLLMVALILHFSAFVRADKRSLFRPILDWSVLVSLALGLFLTTSRSAYLGFVAGLFAFLVFQKTWRRVAIIFAVIMTGVAGVLLSPLRGLVLARIFSLKQVASRVDIMQAGLRAFLESPIFGLGLGVFFEVSQNRFGLPWKQIIHNSYLWILADMGLFGIMVWAYFFLVIFKESKILLKLASRRFPDFLPEVIAVFSAFIAMCVFALGIEAFYQRHLWMLVGIILGLRAVWRGEGVLSLGQG